MSDRYFSVWQFFGAIIMVALLAVNASSETLLGLILGVIVVSVMALHNEIQVIRNHQLRKWINLYQSSSQIYRNSLRFSVI